MKGPKITKNEEGKNSLTKKKLSFLISNLMSNFGNMLGKMTVIKIIGCYQKDNPEKEGNQIHFVFL